MASQYNGLNITSITRAMIASSGRLQPALTVTAMWPFMGNIELHPESCAYLLTASQWMKNYMQRTHAETVT